MSIVIIDIGYIAHSESGEKDFETSLKYASKIDLLVVLSCPACTQCLYIVYSLQYNAFNFSGSNFSFL
jgi:hypothetical protein